MSRGLGDFSTSGYETAIAASISLTTEARVLGLPASAFWRATRILAGVVARLNYAPLLYAVVVVPGALPLHVIVVTSS